MSQLFLIHRSLTLHFTPPPPPPQPVKPTVPSILPPTVFTTTPPPPPSLPPSHHLPPPSSSLPCPFSWWGGGGARKLKEVRGWPVYPPPPVYLPPPRSVYLLPPDLFNTTLPVYFPIPQFTPLPPVYSAPLARGGGGGKKLEGARGRSWDMAFSKRQGTNSANFSQNLQSFETESQNITETLIMPCLQQHERSFLRWWRLLPWSQLIKFLTVELQSWSKHLWGKLKNKQSNYIFSYYYIYIFIHILWETACSICDSLTVPPSENVPNREKYK